MTDYNTIAESNHFILLDKYGETPWIKSAK
jgi:hypothetical protein